MKYKVLLRISSEKKIFIQLKKNVTNVVNLIYFLHCTYVKKNGSALMIGI